MPPPRIVAIDALRGVAALVVVLWHWPHFFQLQATPDAALPLYALLWPFYRYGAWGVDLFFCISGFVFYTQYADAVAGRMLSSLAFARLRFSRLYPLHLVTLLAVAALQSVFTHQTGHAFVYSDLSWRSFALQLALASNWWTRPYSFNGPVWSVSVEILLYASFFVLARIGAIRPPVLLAVAVAGMFLMPVNEDVARGLAAFFVGCLCGIAVARARAGSFGLGAWLALIVVATLWAQTGISRAELIVKWAVFPGLVIALALADGKLRAVSERLHWLGDISYSSYLIHFPLQLTLVTFAATTGAVIDFSSPWTLGGFFVALVALSLLSFHRLERPAMRWIRMSRSPASRPGLHAAR
ncbi:MAG: acyltransferase [Xanthobacteraceae bacterium]|nr:acyltransferase [Xanthobacteraceae bacterium]